MEILNTGATPAATAVVVTIPTKTERDLGAAARFLGQRLVGAVAGALVLTVLGLTVYLVVMAVGGGNSLSRDWLQGAAGKLSVPLLGVIAYGVGLVTRQPGWAGGV